MAIPKEKKTTRVAGRRKFELPPREERVITDNPVRELLKSITAESESAPAEPVVPIDPTASHLAELPSVPARNALASRQVNTVVTQKTKQPKEPRPKRQLVVQRGDSFELFRQKYGRLLGKARAAVCEAIYDLSYGLGQTECFYSASKLAEATGFSDRYIFKLVGQLESFGFIEKVEIFNTATKKGTTFRLHLEPILKPLKS